MKLSVAMPLSEQAFTDSVESKFQVLTQFYVAAAIKHSPSEAAARVNPAAI